MDIIDMRLDGNAAAGMLFEVFGKEMTAVRGRCSHCSAVSITAAQHVYTNRFAPGAVIRCRSCEGLLAVIVARDGAFRVATPGIAWMEAETTA